MDRAEAERRARRALIHDDQYGCGVDVPNPPCADCRRVAEELMRVQRETAKEIFKRVIDALWERTRREEYGHAKAAVTLDIEAVETIRAAYGIEEQK